MYYSWWSPEGWALRECKPYNRVLAADAEADYIGQLHDAGYTKVVSTEFHLSNAWLFPTEVWNHDDGHLLVQTELPYRHAPYFVDTDDAVAFFADRWPAILRDIILAEQTVALKTIATTLEQ